MKKRIFCSLIAFLGLSCEEDDICVDEKTPQLVIRLNAFDDNSSLDSIIIKRYGIDNTFETISKAVLADSVKVSLRLDDVSQTQLIIANRSTQSSDYKADTIVIDYTRDVIFGSKACGYKLNYLDMNYQISGDLFQDSEVLKTQIINEETAHLLLYY